MDFAGSHTESDCVNRARGLSRQPWSGGARQRCSAGVKWVLRIRGVSPRPANDVGIYLAKFIVDLEKSGYFETVELVRDILTPDEEDYCPDYPGSKAANGC